MELKKLKFSMLAFRSLVQQGFQRGGGGAVDDFLREKLEVFFQKTLPVLLLEYNVSQNSDGLAELRKTIKFTKILGILLTLIII